MHVRENARVIKDIDGNVLFYEGTVEDITEKKKAEEELKKYQQNLELLVVERTKELIESEEKFRALSENVDDAIIRFDSNYRHLYVKSGHRKINWCFS